LLVKKNVCKFFKDRLSFRLSGGVPFKSGCKDMESLFTIQTYLQLIFKKTSLFFLSEHKDMIFT
jgi:hypothetical protein